jgi:hypothetical protein
MSTVSFTILTVGNSTVFIHTHTREAREHEHSILYYSDSGREHSIHSYSHTLEHEHMVDTSKVFIQTYTLELDHTLELNIRKFFGTIKNAYSYNSIVMVMLFT